MSIQLVCSNDACRKPLKVRDELKDKRVKCPTCGEQTQVTEDRVLPFLTLGSYSLVRKIGEGGMGTVYHGVQTKLDRHVALKVLPKFRTEDKAFLERFEREAKAAAALNHPNIVQVYDIGEENGTHFFAMEFVDGEDLAQRLEREEKLPLEDGLSIIHSIAKALQFAHSRTIIHRDIKPDNIMVSQEGDIKLADMGLAKSVDEDKGVTATGVGLGTPYYMAPEQAEDASRADHRSDIYALGITLLHLLTGRRPFDGPTAVSVILAHREQSLPTGKELGTELPPNVEALTKDGRAEPRQALRGLRRAPCRS
jgi:serine/threonine-protein kinase